MPSISSRPSASTMRQPCVRHDRQRRRARLHLRIGQPDVVEPGRDTSSGSACVSAARSWPMHSSASICHGGFRHSLPATGKRAHSVTHGSSLDDFAHAKLAALERGSLRRSARRDHPRGRHRGSSATAGGCMSFSCNDYLDLTQHPASRRRRSRRSRRYGVGAGASRLVTGNHPLLCRAGDAAGAPQGDARQPACSAPAISPIPASSRRWSAAAISCSSTSLPMPACGRARGLSGATVLPFRHNDVAHAQALLARAPRAPRRTR